MNGVVFTNLPQLVLVNLRRNACVDRIFTTERNINTFRRKISRNCELAGVAKKEVSCKASVVCNAIMLHQFKQMYNRSASCCSLKYGTRIESSDYSFNADVKYNNLEIMYIARQQNIEFLPVLVRERFPNLKFYFAIDTPVTKISKKNFENMFELTMLHLQRNRIEVIKSNTFEDLTSLRQIRIGTGDYVQFNIYFYFIFFNSVPTPNCFE